MKINSTFHVLVFCVVLLTLSMTFVTHAQQNLVVAQAEADATADANKDVNKPLWFGTGCLISGLVFLPLPWLVKLSFTTNRSYGNLFLSTSTSCFATDWKNARICRSLHVNLQIKKG